MPEVQDIFSQYGNTFEATHKMSLQQSKAFHAIRCCRTSILGGHMDRCPHCGYQHPSYNSCRNRHCPKCQT
ncbi:MAG: transposase zinc-binding domain-containing protein, partial [Acidaminococcaceae bacterium]|nr:transposase zinc-binding domain-containing protein [Acidaminococcaceae bacterium]